MMEINTSTTAFDDRTDFSRNNPKREQWGKTSSTTGLNLGTEYDVIALSETVKTAESSKAPEPQKFTHKLADGTMLEAASVEELATKIEASFKQTVKPIVLEFEDKPLYVPYEFKRKELTLAEQAEILNVWKENPQKAMRMLQEADLGAPTEVLVQKLQEAQTMVRQRMEEEAGAEFVGEIEEYRATPANGKKLVEYLRAKGKPITKQNLVLSFQQLVAAGDKSLLRTVEEQAEPESAITAKDENLTEAPPPPTRVPSNQGRLESPAQAQIDVAKFAALPLDKQKEYFASLRRQK